LIFSHVVLLIKHSFFPCFMYSAILVIRRTI